MIYENKLRLAYNDAVSSFLTPFKSAVHKSAVFRLTFNPWQQLRHELLREYPPIRRFPKTWLRLRLALLQASWVSYNSSSDPFTLSHNPLLRRGAAHRASFPPLAPSPVPCRDSVVGTQVSFAKVPPPSPSCLGSSLTRLAVSRVGRVI